MEKKRLTQRIAMLAAMVGSTVLVISLMASQAPAGSPNHQYCNKTDAPHCPSCEDSKDEDVPWQCVPGIPNGYAPGSCAFRNLGDNCDEALLSCNTIKFDCADPPHSLGIAAECTATVKFCADTEP